MIKHIQKTIFIPLTSMDAVISCKTYLVKNAVHYVTGYSYGIEFLYHGTSSVHRVANSKNRPRDSNILRHVGGIYQTDYVHFMKHTRTLS